MMLNFAAMWDTAGFIEIREGCGGSDATREASYLRAEPEPRCHRT